MMQRRIIGTILSAIAIVAVSFAAPPRALAQGAPHCAPGQSPAFVLGFAGLQARLGAAMGVPLECEHINADNGDTIQHTSTGLAYYRPAINTPIFTDGQSHWSLSNNQLLKWRNSSIEPPSPTAAEWVYLGDVLPMSHRLDAFQARVAAIQRQANAGRIEVSDMEDVGTLYDDLTAARDTVARASASDRLASYDRNLLGAFEEAVGATEFLLRARLTDVPEARSAFINEAAARAAVSERLQRDAMDAYSLVLTVIVG